MRSTDINKISKVILKYHKEFGGYKIHQTEDDFNFVLSELKHAEDFIKNSSAIGVNFAGKLRLQETVNTEITFSIEGNEYLIREVTQ